MQGCVASAWWPPANKNPGYAGEYGTRPLLCPLPCFPVTAHGRRFRCAVVVGSYTENVVAKHEDFLRFWCVLLLIGLFLYFFRMCHDLPRILISLRRVAEREWHCHRQNAVALGLPTMWNLMAKHGAHTWLRLV